MYAYWKRDGIIIFNLIAGHNPSTGIMNMRPERSILCKISPITTTHDRYKWIVLLVQYVFQVDKQKKQIGLPRNSSASEEIVSHVHVQLIHLIIIIICPKKVVNSSEEIDSEDTQELLDNIRRVIGHHSFTRLNAQHSTAHTICSDTDHESVYAPFRLLRFLNITSHLIDKHNDKSRRFNEVILIDNHLDWCTSRQSIGGE